MTQIRLDNPLLEVSAFSPNLVASLNPNHLRTTQASRDFKTGFGKRLENWQKKPISPQEQMHLADALGDLEAYIVPSM
ncbi:MAG: hypothetical protein F6J86_14530 [Symploca sp. SIO1B1]|nr:hypothetical protein [Symploca sp. SIO1A3]NER95028.1 hypothetical protein [Symploca sp. SIO1B1]